MTDEEIVELHNDLLRAQAKCAAEYKHVAVEVPLGSPQIEYSAPADQWTPRESVLRCYIEDDEDARLVVGIDDHELTFEHFGRLLTTLLVGECGSNLCPRPNRTAAPRMESESLRRNRFAEFRERRKTSGRRTPRR